MASEMVESLRQDMRELYEDGLISLAALLEFDAACPRDDDSGKAALAG